MFANKGRSNFVHLTTCHGAKAFYDDVNEAYQRTNPPAASPHYYDYEVREVES